jgi:molybdate transport system substrate-binding protein
MHRVVQVRASDKAMAALFAWALALVLAHCRQQDRPAELLVFAAASTADAMTDLGREFRAKTGATTVFSFGATGDLARQIREGAPADVLVSADADAVDALVGDHLVAPADRRPIASNRLVVIVPKDSRLRVTEPGDLKNARLVAIGDPEVVPAGRYAKKWLEKAGLWAELGGHVVPTLDVRAALAAVESGRADAGIVYATDAASSSRVEVSYQVPRESAPEITYVAARLSRSTLASAARFVEFSSSNEARSIFLRHGFVIEERPP